MVDQAHHTTNVLGRHRTESSPHLVIERLVPYDWTNKLVSVKDDTSARKREVDRRRQEHCESLPPVDSKDWQVVGGCWSDLDWQDDGSDELRKVGGCVFSRVELRGTRRVPRFPTVVIPEGDHLAHLWYYQSCLTAALERKAHDSSSSPNTFPP